MANSEIVVGLSISISKKKRMHEASSFYAVEMFA